MTITALTDAQLLDQARHGDEAAFTELYVRHQAAALRLARTYTRLGDPDDVVNSAFERVLGALRRGAGPTESFRAYLFVTLRRLAAEEAERPAGQPLDEVPEPVGSEVDSPELAQADRSLINQAFERLPDRWQAVLWHTAVEGRQPRELAGVLGVSANAAAAMAYRAREKLRQEYLQAHLLATPAPDHEPYRSQLGAFVRDGLCTRDRDAVQRHLDGCPSCTALIAELEDVNRTLARAVLPLFVLAGGGRLAAGAALGGAAAAGSAGAGGDGKGMFGKLRHAAPTVGSTAAIAAVLGGIVGMGAIVGREDAGPLDSAADAADIGGTGPDDDGDLVDGDPDSDSLFGDDDFALSPFDDELGDLGELGDRFDFDDDPPTSISTARPAPARGPSSPPPSTPRPPAAPPATPAPSVPTPSAPAPSVPPPTPPPTTPPPTTPPPTTPPPTVPPTPAPLTFASSSWAPTGAGTGTLSFTIGEAAGVGATPSAGPVSGAQAAPLVLRVTLSGPATFPDVGLPPRCTRVAPATIDCGFDQPASRGTVPPHDLPVLISGPGATATAEIRRGGVTEATLADPVQLTPFEAGISIGYPVVPWIADGPGVGTLHVTVAQAELWDASGLTISVTLTGGAHLDLARPAAGCVEQPSGPDVGVSCPVPTVPGNGSVEVLIPLVVEGQGEMAQRLTLLAGGTQLATLDQRVALPTP